ncbi:ribosomal protein L15 [Methanohalobium evestigatum Z-7303]|uniref:Large ribosomal subunit protein eL18 n=1 Tax=Methanohalobium evestigatum (strain ATCC BAA-1072 / DSM 3721 / NBRC 107634 / OCM 161 / Z-7303) TaxID=644295 RepID=D7E6L9_METEZ|nr:50S ribosomal protein L18e [Methanohalobium evestigatum]ADI73241.1 ribosomal protein L15 [Methanohalobium evestigatum Z-7303]
MSKKSQKRVAKKTNPRIVELIGLLKETSHTENAPIWKDLAKRLEKPNRTHAEINLSKIDRNTDENEIVLVPGKVLGAGDLGHGVTVAALKISNTAKDKIESVGGKILTIEDILEENPSGSGIKILQ